MEVAILLISPTQNPLFNKLKYQSQPNILLQFSRVMIKWIYHVFVT